MRRGRQMHRRPTIWQARPVPRPGSTMPGTKPASVLADQRAPFEVVRNDPLEVWDELGS
jgi:hypothetical protein